MAISFSNKSSRYLCSGGSGQVVRIWDLQRKRCIKWLKGHTDTITGAIYNCKDEHLASVSLSGDVILHSLASGAKAAEFKDPKNQVVIQVSSSVRSQKASSFFFFSSVFFSCMLLSLQCEMLRIVFWTGVESA